MNKNQIDNFINIYEFTDERGEKCFIYSQKIDELSYSYFIITTDEQRKPLRRKITRVFEIISEKRITPVLKDSEAYITFINVYSIIQRQNKNANKTPYSKALTPNKKYKK